MQDFAMLDESNWFLNMQSFIVLEVHILCALRSHLFNEQDLIVALFLYTLRIRFVLGRKIIPLVQSRIQVEICKGLENKNLHMIELEERQKCKLYRCCVTIDRMARTRIIIEPFTRLLALNYNAVSIKGTTLHLPRRITKPITCSIL